jgi:CrcB protein
MNAGEESLYGYRVWSDSAGCVVNPAALSAVALGGALGSVARYCISIYAARLVGTHFPWGTLFINVSASLMLGALIEVFALRWDTAQSTRILLVVGVCGGYSTFSTFSLEVVTLATRGALAAACAYAAASVLFSVAALVAGMRLLRVLLA